jgi:hypothetical protein
MVFFFEKKYFQHATLSHMLRLESRNMFKTDKLKAQYCDLQKR